LIQVFFIGIGDIAIRITKEIIMKKSLNTFLFIIFISFAFPQSNFSVKMEMGNGTSSVSDYFLEIEERGFSADIRVDRLKSTVRNLKFEIETDNYYDEYFQTLGSIVSASASGIQIKIKEGREGILLDIGKFSIALNNWDLFIDNNGPKNMPVFSWKLDLQSAVITPTTEMTRNLGEEEWKIFNYITGGTNLITVNKISGDISMKQNGKISAKGSVMLPVGKVAVNLLATLDRDLKSEPYINSLKLDLTNLSPEVKAFLNDLILNEDVPLRKKGNGFSLQMTGSLNNPRFR
tara:strand:+ start:1098 stop:1970 length:873 start_codon:yes stop_codon:yes gene_type:complete